MYLGFDSSTQSCSATIIDPAKGEIVLECSVNFGTDLPQYGCPNGFLPNGKDGEVHADPLMWLAALDLLLARMTEGGADLSQIKVISGSGQQHGSVYLNSSFHDRLEQMDAHDSLVENLATTLSRRTSPIWMDSSTSTQCAELATAVGGDSVVCAKSGSIAVERFTGPQIRKFAQSDEQAYAETDIIHLVSSFLCSVLAGQSAPIDKGDGAGMNLLNLASGDWDADLVEATAPDLGDKLPPVADTTRIVGQISPYFVRKYGFDSSCQITAWSGDNPCSLVGMGASSPGTAVISLGTSDTFFAAMPEAVTDPNGYGHVFGNPMGGYMSLICFMNGSLAREQLKNDYGLSWDDFGSSALAETPAGNKGRLLLPFYNNEITPKLDSDGPIYNSKWQEADEANPALLVRATLEGQFLNMRAQCAWMGIQIDQVRVTGGASQNDGICQVIADVFGCPISRLDTTGSAGLGAALQAAVAGGLSLSDLENTYCQTSNTLQPSAQATQTYADLQPALDTLLEQALES